VSPRVGALKRIGVLHNHRLFFIRFVIIVKYTYIIDTSTLLIYFDD
jgi:hypothetical protein